MNLEEEQKKLKGDKEKLLGKAQAIEARLEVIPNEIELLENALIEEAISGHPDYQNSAILFAGYQLEHKTLPIVLNHINTQLMPIRSRLESIAWKITDKEVEERRLDLIGKIKALKGQGESPKTIRESLGLDQREYERLSA